MRRTGAFCPGIGLQGERVVNDGEMLAENV